MKLALQRFLPAALLLAGALVVAGAGPATGAGTQPAGAASGWGQWTKQAQPLGVSPAPLTSVSCPSTSLCVAAGGSLVDSTDGGSTWNGGVIPAGFLGVTYVQCQVATTTCMAAGMASSNSSSLGVPAVALSVNPTRTWSAPVLLPGMKYLYGLSCFDRLNCLAWGADDASPTFLTVDTTTNAGSSWISRFTAFNDATSQAIDSVNGVSCATASLCVATADISSASPSGADAALIYTTDGGGTWATDDLTTALSVPTVGPISCPAATTCEVVGPTSILVGTYTAGGTPSPWSWSPQLLPTGSPALNAIDCTATNNCYAVAKGKIASMAGGASTWSLQAAPAADYVLVSVSCASPAACWAVGGDQVPVDTSLDSTITGLGSSGSWNPEYLGAMTQFPESVSCSSASACMVVTSAPAQVRPSGIVDEAEALSTTDGGRSWVPRPLPAGVVPYGLSCVSGVCRVSAREGNGGGSDVVLTTTDSGAQWHTSATVTGLGGLSCPSTSECIMPGDGSTFVAVTQDGGAHWTSVSLPGVEPLDVDCPSTTVCLAFGPGGLAESLDGGASWHARKSPLFQNDTIESVSCPSIETCYAAISDGAKFVFALSRDGGSTWTSASTESFAAIASIDCPAVEDCIALESAGGNGVQVLDSTNFARSWTTTELSSYAAQVAGACASTVCVADDSAGDIWRTELVPGTPVGYRLAVAGGSVFAAGAAEVYGSIATSAASDPVVGIGSTPDGDGYWEVTRDGTVAAFGDAVSYGDLPALGVTVSDVVAIAPTADGKGYWLIGADGGEFVFGDAHFHGSLPGLGVRVHDVVGMVATPSGSGYLIVGADGGVFVFGGSFHGSLPGIGVHVHDIVGILPSPAGTGYDLVGADGGVFAFGSGVHFYGSLPGRHISVTDIVGLALTPDTLGYWLAGADGTVYAFGDGPVLARPNGLTGAVVAIAAT